MGPPNIMSLSLSDRKCLRMAIIALPKMKVRMKMEYLRMAREQGSQRHRWPQD